MEIMPLEPSPQRHFQFPAAGYINVADVQDLEVGRWSLCTRGDAIFLFDDAAILMKLIDNDAGLY
jgi:hypothetical protein